MVVGNVFAILVADVLLGAFRTGRRDLDLVAFLVLHLTVVSVLVLAAGLAGGLRAPVLGGGCALGLGMLLAMGGYPSLAADLRALLAGCRPPAAAGTAARVGYAAVFGFAALLVGVVLVQVWLLAPYWIDVTSYQLPKVAEWVREGRIFFPELADQRAYWPSGFQLLQAWWTVFLHHDVVIELAGVESYLLAGAATAALARNLGLARGTAALAGVLVLSLPAMVAIAPSGSNDIGAAATVLACAALLSAPASPEVGSRRTLAAVVFLLGIGIKPTVGMAVPALVVLAGWRARGGAARAGAVVRGAVLALALLLGIAWYAENLVHFGSPFYPATIGGTGKFAQGTPRLQNLADNLSALLGDRLYDRGPIGPALANVAGWGWLALAAGLPAIAVALGRSRAFRVAGAAFAAGLLAVLTLVAPDPFNMRYVLWCPALLCAAIASVLEAPWPPAARRIWIGLVALGCALNLATVVVPQQLGASALRALVARGWRERSALDSEHYGALAIPDDETLGVVSSGSGQLYPLYGTSYARRLVYLHPTSVDDLVATMRADGLRHVFRLETTVDEDDVFRDAVTDGHLVPVTRRLYALR
jgi:hypothetical protein